MSKHTPGPWRVAPTCDTRVISDGRKVIADTDHYTVPTAEAIANAALITAAPELLAALRHLSGYGCPACGGDCGSANPPVIKCPLQEAVAAIAKAEGRE